MNSLDLGYHCPVYAGDEFPTDTLIDRLLMDVRHRSRGLSAMLCDVAERLRALSPAPRRMSPGLPVDRLDALLAIASDVENSLIELARLHDAPPPDSTSPNMELCSALWSFLLRRGCPAHLVAEGYYLTSQLCYESKRDMASAEILYLLAHPAVCCRAEELQTVSEAFRIMNGGKQDTERSGRSSKACLGYEATRQQPSKKVQPGHVS